MAAAQLGMRHTAAYIQDGALCPVSEPNELMIGFGANPSPAVYFKK